MKEALHNGGIASQDRSNSGLPPTSGSRSLKHPFQSIARLNKNNSTGQTFVLLACGLNLIVIDSQSGQVVKSWDAETVGSKGWISLVTVNAESTYVAIVTSEDKAVHILSTSFECLLQPLNKRVLPKRPSCITWTPDQLTLLAGDKFGDVYALPLHAPPVSTSLAQSEQLQSSAASSEQEYSTIIVRTEGNSPEPTSASDQPPPAKRFKPSATELTVHSGRNLRALENQKRTAAMKHDMKKEIDSSLTVALGHVSMLTALASKAIAPSRAAPSADTMCRTREQYTAWTAEASKHSRSYIITADRDEHIRISRGLPQSHIIETYCLGHTSFISALTTLDGPASNILFSGGGDDWLGVWDWLRGTLICKIPLTPAFAAEPQPHDKPAARQLAVSGIWHWPAADPMTDDCIRLAVACEGVPQLLTLTCKTLAPSSDRDFEQRVHKMPGNVLDFTPINAETAVLSLDAAHESGSTKVWRKVRGEETGTSEERCPRLFVLRVDGQGGNAVTTSSSDAVGDSIVLDEIDSKVSAALNGLGMDVVLDAGKDQGKMNDMLYGVEKLRKWAGEHEDV